ncbi:unnamed protein product [Blepharisma stoltei]|uniref:Uncharacterized protein n=1 Tax=Blepharisma stoltei TaxID=1481888 RepID=A0AAU9IHX1_9CILI|nr:unnamed protein product [Blepharisma stoltei]
MIIDQEERTKIISVYSECLYKDLCIHIEWKYGIVLRRLTVLLGTWLLNYDKWKNKKISKIGKKGIQNGDSLRIMNQNIGR